MTRSQGVTQDINAPPRGLEPAVRVVVAVMRRVESLAGHAVAGSCGRSVAVAGDLGVSLAPRRPP